jgi:hypothetical protein
VKGGCIRSRLPLFPLKTAGAPKSLRPSPVSTTASPPHDP